MDKIRFGLLGTGRIGKVFAHHLVSTVQHADLVAAADPISESLQEVTGKYNIPGYTHPDNLLSNKDVDAVVIATPTGTHLDMVKLAASAGKQIFCEKPLSLTIEGSLEALRAVNEAGVKLQVGFMRRFDSAYAYAKEQIEAGLIGKPVIFKSVGRDPKRTSLDFARRENSGGLIMDMGIHDFDLARWLMGSEVIRVHSEGACLVYPELKEVGDIDNAVINLAFASGAVGNVDVSRNAVYAYDIRTEILGSEGGLMIGKLQQTPVLLMTQAGIQHDTVPYFMQRFADAFSSELEHFTQCILENRQPSVTGTDALMAVAIGVAATRSLDEGRPIGLESNIS